MADNKYTKRRLQLKQNLFKLLKEREPDGIPKAHLWNIYTSKVEKVSAAFYGTGKMHNLLGEFDDMIYEVMEKGRPTIRLIEGYTPDEEGSPDVQIAKVSSSELEDNHTEPKSVNKSRDVDDKKRSSAEVRTLSLHLYTCAV